MRVTAVVPTYEGRALLPACLTAIAAQTRPFDDVVVVDDGSRDGTVDWLAAEWPGVRVVRRAANGGFAAAANAGVAIAQGDWVALVNTDVLLDPGWLEQALVPTGDGECAAVATKLVTPDGVVDDAGDTLRRDGVCEQRGRGRRDDGRFDRPGPMWGACAGAALYRRSAVIAAGGFDERLRQYLEDVDLALRLRMAGWTCWYVPAVAVHEGAASAGLLPEPVRFWTARNTLILVARAFPWRWTPLVAYRQAAWLVAAARAGGPALRAHLRGLRAGVTQLPAAWAARHGLRARALVPVDEAVPSRAWRGPRAGGHPGSPE